MTGLSGSSFRFFEDSTMPVGFSRSCAASVIFLLPSVSDHRLSATLDIVIEASLIEQHRIHLPNPAAIFEFNFCSPY